MVSEGLLKVINYLPIVCIALGLIGDFLSFYFWSLIITGVVKVFLVVCLILLEVKPTPGLAKPFSFMYYFLGRGTFYIIIGFTTMGVNVLSIIGNFLTVAIGIFYIVLHYTNTNGEPEFMSFDKYLRLVNASVQTPYIHQQNNSSYPVPPQPVAKHQNYNSGNYEPYPKSPMSSYNNTQDKTEISTTY